MVYTAQASIFTGGYFFNYETLHHTKVVRSLGRPDLTNDRRDGSFRTLCRMMINLRYRAEPGICLDADSNILPVLDAFSS